MFHKEQNDTNSRNFLISEGKCENVLDPSKCPYFLLAFLVSLDLITVIGNLLLFFGGISKSEFEERT